MLVAETVLGHRDAPAVAERLAEGDPSRVVLSDTERRRSRVRTETLDCQDLGIVVGSILRDGDVLETTTGHLVVVKLAEVKALVVEVSADDVTPTTALVLGHAVGNRHWDLAVRDDEALIPVADSQGQIETMVRNQLPDGASIRYETVPPSTFDDVGTDHEHHHAGDDHVHGAENG